MKARPFPPARSRADIVRNRTALKRVIAAFFADQLPSIIQQCAIVLGLEKAEEAPVGPKADKEQRRKDAEARAKAIADRVAIDWAQLALDAEESIAAMTVAGGRLALDALDQRAYDEFGDGMRERAEDYAHQRAAEMVGKRWVNGTLIDNPNSKWQISESTRDSLRGYVRDAILEGDSAQDLASRIKNSFAFSSERAIMIARTEIAKADSEGAIIGWQSTGMVKGKSWLPDDDPCPICLEFADEGVVPLDHDYGDGIKAAPAHPNCECTMLPELIDGDEGSDYEAPTADELEME